MTLVGCFGGEVLTNVTRGAALFKRASLRRGCRALRAEQDVGAVS